MLGNERFQAYTPVSKLHTIIWSLEVFILPWGELNHSSEFSYHTFSIKVTN